MTAAELVAAMNEHPANEIPYEIKGDKIVQGERVAFVIVSETTLNLPDGEPYIRLSGSDRDV